jgi:hypothetical protein
MFLIPCYLQRSILCGVSLSKVRAFNALIVAFCMQVDFPPCDDLLSSNSTCQ